MIHRDIREDYIRALEKADAGDLKPLVGIFAAVERKAFVKVLSISETALQSHEPYRQIIDSVTDKLKARQEAQFRERQSVFEVSKSLERLVGERLQPIASDLNRELGQFNTAYRVFVEQSVPNTDHFFRKQIVETARKLDYYADTRAYRAWTRMKIQEDRQVELVISFHALGVEFLGIMAVSAFMEYRDRGEEDEIDIEGPYILCKDVFQFSYNESEDSVSDRFEPWLNEVMITGLDQWRRQL